MKVRLDTAVISAGGAESPSGFRLIHTRGVETVDFVRGTYGGQFARGQLRTEISFVVSRLHASMRAAVAFILDHPQSIPLSGTLEIVSDIAVGMTSTRWISGAVVSRVELLRFAGLTTVWAYQFIGGEVIKKNPRGSLLQ